MTLAEMHCLVIRLNYLTVPLALDSKALIKSLSQSVQCALSNKDKLMTFWRGIVNPYQIWQNANYYRYWEKKSFFSSSRKVLFLFVQENELIYFSELSDNMFFFIPLCCRQSNGLHSQEGRDDIIYRYKAVG